MAARISCRGRNTRLPHARRATAGLLCTVVLVAGCGGSEEPTTIVTPVESASASTTPDADADASASADEPASDGDTTPAGDDSSATPDDEAMAGEPWEGFAAEGDELAVVRVAHDDELNVREGPGTDRAVVTTTGPTEDTLVATGRARQLPRSFWYEVELDGVTGWASAGFLAFVGATDDTTAALIGSGERPRADTMQQLGAEVAALVASDDPPSDVVMSVAPSVGDLGEVTYDVIGLGDDSVLGVRLHVFGEPDDGGEGFVLRTVEQTTLCIRGAGGGVCV